MNLINKIGLMVALLIAVFVYCKLDERKTLAYGTESYSCGWKKSDIKAIGTYGEFEGIVTNIETTKPVYRATVKFYDSTGQLKSTVYTNSTGHYITKVWNGTYRIEVSKVGWESKTKTAYTCCILLENPTLVNFRIRKIQL